MAQTVARERVAYARYQYSLSLVALSALAEEEGEQEVHRMRRWVP